MKIGVLTSSRADIGTYIPLLRKIKDDAFFELEIIAFGTHASRYHGFTLDDVNRFSFGKVHVISSLLTNDDKQSIATAYGLTVLKFADFWATHTFDWVVCLGDRFEMSAAVQAGIPFGIKYAHLHGGETTLGAIDNIYRHQITLASTLHFTSIEAYSKKVSLLTGTRRQIYTVGSLGLDELPGSEVKDINLLRKEFELPKGKFILSTFHPETVAPEKNYSYANEMCKALGVISNSIDIVVTMPNADTSGSIFREALYKLQSEKRGKVFLIENFGKENYFSAMKNASLLIGNTSSGIVEAASFEKYVINVGNRQKGRVQSANTFNCKFTAVEMEKTFKNVIALGDYKGSNIYSREGVADKIIKTLKAQSEKL